MKTKQLILSTMAVAWGVFGATYSFASVADDQNYLNTHVRVTDIDLVAPAGVVGAGNQIHFDVTLSDVKALGTSESPFADWRIDSVSLKSAGSPSDHPYLTLNVPFEGDSVNANTGTTLKTTEARAYFNGMYNKKVRFTYTVRPGDMVTKLQWMKTPAGDPDFKGWQSLSVSFYRGSGVLAPSTIGMQPDALKKNGDIDAGLPEVPVSGYTFEVGDRTGDKYDSNYDVLRGGLVPVTIAVPEGGRSPKGKSYVWAMNKDGTKYYPVAVTNMTSPDAIIKISPNTLTPADSFSDIMNNTATLTSPVTSASPLRVMVNVPEESTDEIRICFGRKPGNLPTSEPQNYAYFNHIVEKEGRVRNNFTLQGSELIAQTDGTFTLATEIASGLTDAGLATPLAKGAQVKEGGEVTVAVGGVASLRITSDFQKYLPDTGTVYAALEQISQEDVAGVKPAVYAIPLTSDGFVLKIAGADAAPADPKNNATEYRIRIPGLKDVSGDRYYYLRVRSVPKQEIITLTAAPDASTELRENFPNVTVVPEELAQPAQKFIMQVEPEPDARRFLIHPITYHQGGKIVRITDEFVFADQVDGKYLKVLDALARYVSVQQGSPSLSSNPRATLNIRVSAMATSAEFYFVGVNDDALSGIKGRNIVRLDPVTQTPTGEVITVSGIEFAAAACNGAGVITGENDNSSVVALNVQNRAPAVNVSTNLEGSYDSPHFFQVKVDDVVSDYLVVFGRFAGTPDKDSFAIYANETEMKLLFGEQGWNAQLTRIQNMYGAEFGFASVDELRTVIKDRALASEVLMRPTFIEGRDPSWQIVAFDSSFTKTEVSGVLSLDQEQKILVTTVFPGTVDGRGYVLWGDQTPGGTFDSLGWIFGSSYTSSVIKSAGVSYVNAYPFPANADKPDPKFAAISRNRDSFFYCWRYDPKYVPALPDAANPNMPYQPALRINSRFTLEDQKQQAGGKYSDILLSAYFVTEFHEGDAYTAFSKTASSRINLLDLGDYDADGVPDGWVMANYNDRELAEAGSLGKTGAPNDTLPLAGKGTGDEAYRLGNSSGSLGLPGGKGPMAPGAAFTHRMRVRGFDDSLNAADGEGKWLSNPAWVVLVREFNDAGQAVIGTLKKENGKLTLDPNAGWTQIRLNQSGVPAEDESITIQFSAANRIPYANVSGKNYAVGADGHPVKNANYSIIVDPDAETFTLEYANGWIVDAGNTGATEGLTGAGIFPFASAGTLDAFGDLVIDGATVGSFRSDANAIAGVLLDEPFTNPEITRNSWLNRIPVGANAADADGDGMTNGQEYFLWYYASRIAYAAVSEWTAASGEQMTQVHTALWPAIALPKDGKLVVNKSGTIGRGFNPAYDPASDKMEGNFWVPISAEEVMNAFNPQVHGQGSADLDGDGLSNAEELALGTNPIDCDTDGDGMIDGWEVKFGLNPLDASDAFANDDGDAYATTLGSGFFERSDYHPLFKVTLAAPVTGETAMFDPVDNVIVSVPNGELTKLKSVGYISADSARDFKRSALPTPAPAPIGNKIAGYLEMPAKPLALRDHDVYLAFGFDPRTAVSAKTRPAHNTQPFIAVEEFKSAVKLANGAGFKEILRVSSDPTKADTNNDGVPDGWALYVGVRPYLDPSAGLEPGFLDPDADDLITAGEYWHVASDLPIVEGNLSEIVTGWNNKLAPTDPFNSDTDADGIADGAEGRLFKYVATGTQESGSSNPVARIMGHGMNPNSLDTDGDGLSDGWEAAHGLATYALAGLPAAPQGDAEKKDAKANDGNGAPAVTPADGDRYMAYLRAFFPYAVDPTNANDVDLDPDRDGLSNAQEYYIGYLRHLRYDLAADASRLYERFPGKTEKDPLTGEEKVVAVADTFNAIEDLAQPQAVPSPLFTLRGALIGNHGEPGLIDPRSVGVAAGGIGSEGVINAIRSAWDRTIIYPTADQFTDYAEALAGTQVAELEKALVLAVEDLDAVAARRRMNAVTLAYTSPSFARLFDADRMNRELRACIFRVDACVAALVAEANNVSPVLADMFAAQGGKTPLETVWAARRDQLLMTLGGATDPAYAQANAALGTSLTDATQYPNPGTHDPAAYETAVRALKNPIVKIQYRDALRGMNGGLRVDEFGKPYLTVIGWHQNIKPFAERLQAANGAVPEAFFLGSDVTNANVVARHTGYNSASLPYAALAFPTTSPAALDSDLDGMDDYWEIFHGLNPILGDFISKPDEGFAEGSASDIAYAADRIGLVTGLKPTVDNPFANEEMNKGRVSDYNYVAYPWMAGAPFADPDGDGLTNAEEAVNPMGGDVPRYGTDPSPLWMTDPANPNSVVARFYGSVNLAIEKAVAKAMPAAKRTFFAGISRIVPTPAELNEAVLPFEVNEGFDTDGDGIDDRTELISESVLRGEPQSALSPSRQNVAYFEGKGAMQSHASANFGPSALETFTVECWVNPAAGQNGEVIIVDRPWRYSEELSADPTTPGQAAADLRHNFQIGFREVAGSYEPFARYTGMGTTVSGSTIDYSPNGAPEVRVKGSDVLPVDTWTHLAVTYDGEMLTFYVNGGQRSSIKSGLIPATGVISIKNDLVGVGGETTSVYTFRNAPILIGAAPSQKWFADFSKMDTDTAVTDFGDVFEKTFKGYIDEVRIWNGARTGNEILEAYQRTLTQPELLRFRYTAFMARALGDGLFQTNMPVEPYAIYTFDDMIASTKADKNNPWERFPGASVNQTEPGTLLARRNGLRQALEGKDLSGAPLVDTELKDILPKVEEVFTSYYDMKTPKLSGANQLFSKHYFVKDATSAVTTYEIVPRAQNVVQHLPAMDVEAANFHLTATVFGETLAGGWETPYHRNFGFSPSGDPENLKPVDTVYWTPFAAGRDVEEKAVYNVKVTSNPYAYRHTASTTLGSDYRLMPAYTDIIPTDLMLYGDVYARYTTKSWDGSPSTDNSSGGAGGSSGSGAAKPSENDWFEFNSSKGDANPENGTSWNETQMSNGQAWLDENVGMGQTKDDDADRLPNWWESYYTLDPADPKGDNGAHGDPDGDFLTNFGEYLAGANPMKYSTAGNGVPDFHMPVWMRRGRPTFGLLYSDNDFMEDHWEAEHRSAVLSPDVNDGWEDADGDGWSNWAEARANFRTSRHSTDPSKKHGNSPLGTSTLELPTPAFRMTVDYFGDMNVYTNAAANSQIVVHSYTAVNNNSAPDAVFTLPLAYSSGLNSPEDSSEKGNQKDDADKPSTTGNIAQDVGMWGNGEFSGYLHVGNLIPGSFSVVYTRKLPSSINKDGQIVPGGELVWRIESDTKQNGDTAELFYDRTLYTADKNGKLVADGQVREIVGTINYTTGFYTLSFPKSHPFWGNAKWYKKSDKKGGEATEGTGDALNVDMIAYDGEDFAGTAYYSFRVMPGTSNTYTVVYPASGWMKEGPNNFFVFADLNGNGKWEENEPAGVPDQQNVEVGFDQINRPLHVTLSTIAPPGAIRVNIIDRITSDGSEGAEGGQGNLGGGSVDGNAGGGYFPGFGGGSIPNIGGGSAGAKPHLRYPNDLGLLAPPEAGQAIPERPIDENGRYDVAIVRRANIGLQGPSWTNPIIEFSREYNFQKPYITEDEIFSALPAGLPGSWDGNQLKTEYMVCLLPKGAAINPDTKYQEYAVALVTNHLTKLEQSVTELVSPLGGKEIGNSEINFDWSCNVQVPTFTLKIVKLEGITGEADGKTVFEKTIRGVTPFATDRGNGQILQYRYRYTLNRGVGEVFNGNLFGNGLYRYTLTLNPYNGSSLPMQGTFRLTMRDSITTTDDPMYDEKESAIGEINSVDSYFVRARVRYNGVLCSEADFAGRQVFIEAHYSASFNGDPVAATSDCLVYNDNPASADVARVNPYVHIVRDMKKTSATGEDLFYSTRIDAELRGLATDRSVYLIAYLDLNGNRRRDAWEPWGYATMGKDANAGFYFDPKAVKPTNRKGSAFAAEFYIQDVDTDNDHIADAWEWKANGRPGEPFSKWCEKLTGSFGDQKGKAIWVGAADGSGSFGLTAYGAQLLGFTPKQPLTVAPNGAIEIEETIPGDMKTVNDIVNTVGLDTARELFAQGYDLYGLSVKEVRFDGETITIGWDVSALRASDATSVNVTDAFANCANNSATYAVYGKAALDDAEWTLLESRPIRGVNEPEAQVNVNAAAAKLGDRMPAFFRVILSARTPVVTTAE